LNNDSQLFIENQAHNISDVSGYTSKCTLNYYDDDDGFSTIKECDISAFRNMVSTKM